MATLFNLIKGTQKVLPVALDRMGDGNNTPIKQIRVQEMVGVKTVQILAVQKMSGRFPKSKRPAGSSGVYKQNIKFIYEDREDVGNRLPSSTTDKAKVRCGCDAYYYYFWWWNKKHDAHAGSNFKQYVRKTPPPPEGYPEKNPGKIPGVCKHIAYLVKELRRQEVIK